MFKKFIQKIKKLLKQGMSSKTLAVSLSFGLVFSLIPLPWASTLLISFIGLRLRWNIPLLLLLSYVVFPLQLFLLIPFINFGRWMTGLGTFDLTVEHLSMILESGWLFFIRALGLQLVFALFGWLVVSVPTFLASWLLLRRLLKKWPDNMKMDSGEN
ncbi:MAG: DUF2062 domain-containing protein [Bacteroidetes bacterium]|nr:DUF2062 domain-containing protein [Bacteroidota bacterium]